MIAPSTGSGQARPITLVAVFLLVTGLAPAASQPAQAPQATFRAAADVVSVEASVRLDRRPITGLKAADFDVLDDGVPQTITDVSYEKLPIDITIVLDVSASVTGFVLDELRRAVQQLRADLGPRDRLKIVTFNMRVRKLSDFGDPAPVSNAAFAAITGAGSSAIFDTLAIELTAPVPPGRRHLIVLFSDGQDSNSITDPDVLFEVARNSTPTVAVVLASAAPHLSASVFPGTSSQGTLTVGGVSDRIAKETGGVVVPTAAGENLTSTFRRVLDDFRSSYVLYFTPSNSQRAGAHALDVRVKRPGATVRARSHYVWR